MMPTTFPAAAYNSPKRKRVTYEPEYFSPSASSPSPSVVSVSSAPEVKVREEEDLGSYSPRAAVAGRFKNLAIRGGQNSTNEPSSGSVAQESVATAAPTACWAGSLSDSIDMPGKLSAGGSDAMSSAPLKSAGKNQNQPEEEVATTSAPSAMQQSTSSPRKRRNPPAKPKMHNQRASPPLASNADENPLTWQDSEITGHQPSDPNDDGYGINGVGFKPTAAMAWARSQRRQRQVADWKSREAREAREKRRERRDGTEPDKMRTIQNGAIQKKVKFDV